jgi:SAM-dependent MidA family methyltransferase
VESSAARRQAAAQRLARHVQAGRATAAADLPQTIPVGCILSNELFDAMPVHRVVASQGTLREIYVTWDGQYFREQCGVLSTPEIPRYFAEQGIRLQDAQQAEVNLAACRWIERAARTLERGFVMTIDYGHAATELYNEHHLRGTLLAYYRHRTSEDFYAAPGEQDLTAHVNFTALELWGARAGLALAGRVPQARFLLALGRTNEFADLYEPDQSETDRVRARLKLKTLIFPEGMGETFQVLIQHKGVQYPVLTGLAPL